MSELLVLFKSNAKFCFQANFQGWFPDSVAVISFCLPSPWEFRGSNEKYPQWDRNNSEKPNSFFGDLNVNTLALLQASERLEGS